MNYEALDSIQFLQSIYHYILLADSIIFLLVHEENW